jgi:predicted  nucleic acid-binding Zn-ribbon protein
MKKHLKAPLIVLVMVSLVGCEARVEVAKEKALAKIDSLLGTMEVKRKEIDISVRALNDGINGLRKAKIKAQVKHDQLEQKVIPISDKIASVDQSLKKLRDHLASGEPVDIAGKTYGPQELKQMADRVLKARKDYVAQRDGLMEAQHSLQNVVSTLERKQEGYEQRLFRLEGQIAEIDAKRIALKSMQDASAVIVENQENLARNVDQLEDQVLDLFADVQAELWVEDEKWNAASLETELISADAIVAATQDPTDMIAEIDRVLDGQE